MRRFGPIFVMFLFAGTAAAQIPTSGNIYLGYSYYSTDVTGNRGSLNGWEGSLEGKLFPFIGIVTDISGNYGSLNFPQVCVVGPCSSVSASAHILDVLFGPRVSFSVGKFRPFADVMIGASHASTNGFGSDSSFATAVGGGLDYKLIKLVAWRIEGDYVHSSLFNASQGNARVSTGIAVHF
ncbi:MAG TPA: outer membrane beta-barrel protein [Candidatus Binatia bacterium]|jgi:opacity protein-like surface antigen|nr:outer membrane beta-barrel protein [Candidatus Binatia bacterium]